MSPELTTEALSCVSQQSLRHAWSDLHRLKGNVESAGVVEYLQDLELWALSSLNLLQNKQTKTLLSLVFSKFWFVFFLEKCKKLLSKVQVQGLELHNLKQ